MIIRAVDLSLLYSYYPRESYTPSQRGREVKGDDYKGCRKFPTNIEGVMMNGIPKIQQSRGAKETWNKLIFLQVTLGLRMNDSKDDKGGRF